MSLLLLPAFDNLRYLIENGARKTQQHSQGVTMSEIEFYQCTSPLSEFNCKIIRENGCRPLLLTVFYEMSSSLCYCIYMTMSIQFGFYILRWRDGWINVMASHKSSKFLSQVSLWRL